MKKFLSMLLAILLVFSVMAPITVFAENGPYPYNPDSEEVNSDEVSTIVFMDILADMADYDDPLDAIGLLYPFEKGYVLPEAFKGASYDLETNTLTLNNVNLNTVALYLTEMGEDFKIKLEGYNELATIMSSSSSRGASITIIGDGELVVNRLNEMNGIFISAGETPSVFHVEESAKLKVYSDPEIEQPSVTVFGSTILDADEIMPANWRETADGKHILNSVPRDVFWFKWAQLAPDKKHYGDSVFYPWVFHDDGVEPHGNYVRNMHSMRIPYPIEEKQMYYVNDFRVLHCGLLDIERIAAKNRFYQFVDWEMNRRSPISLGRSYAQHFKKNIRHDIQYTLEDNQISFPFLSLVLQ